MRSRRGLLNPDPAGEATRRSPGRGAGAPRLSRRLRVRAAGRRRADSGALRARRGSHSDEIPVPGQRHQPASAFLLPSQIETEGGGREVEKKSQPEREGGEAPALLRPDPLVATSALPRGPAPGAPAAERPRSPSPRWAGASAFLFFSASAPAWKARGCGRSQPAAAGPGRASRAGLPPSAPSHLGLLEAAAVAAAAGGPDALARRSCSVLSLSFFSVFFFFFLGEGWRPPSN